MSGASKRGKGTFRAALAVSVVACAFSCVVAMLMVFNLFAVRSAWQDGLPALERMRQQAYKTPENVEAREQIRDGDLLVRRTYFEGQGALRYGAYLLLGGLVLALGSLKVVSRLSKAPADPSQYPPVEDAQEAARTARFLLASTGVALLVGALALGAAARRPPGGASAALPSSVKAQGGVARTRAKGPVAEADTWSGFRGPAGLGVSSLGHLPSSWDVKTGAGVAWQVPLPLPGASSPVIWANKVFVTGATAERHAVYAFDIERGTMLWEVEVPAERGAAGQPLQVSQDTGHAAPTPVTDGVNVYAAFANGDVAAVDVCSQLKWTAHLGTPVNRYGFSSSPVLHEDMVIVQFDNAHRNGDPSELIGLDKTTGKVIWRVGRPVADSWATPLLVQAAAGPQLVTVANDWIIAHDPGTGALIWQVKCQGTDTAPSAVFARDLVIVPVTSDQIYAIKPQGKGDVSASAVAWTTDEGVSDVPSPVSYGDHVFLLHSGGMLTCLDARTGKKVWEQDLEGPFYASPVIAGDQLYVVTRAGDVIVLRAGPAFQELGRGHLGEPSDAMPAFAPGRIVLRGQHKLFGIGQAAHGG